MNSLITFSTNIRLDTNGMYKQNITAICTDFYEGIYNIYGYHLMSFLTNKMNFLVKKTSLSTTVFL